MAILEDRHEWRQDGLETANSDCLQDGRSEEKQKEAGSPVSMGAEMPHVHSDIRSRQGVTHKTPPLSLDEL